MASVMQRESEAIYVGALTNMAAAESVVTRNVSVPGASAIKTIISVSPNWRKVLKLFRQTEVCCAYGEIGDRQR